MSVLHLVQNLFPKTKKPHHYLNAQYMVFFKNPCDTSQLTHLAKQMYPGKVKFESFENATKVTYGYLVIDLKQETPEQLRLRTSIFPDDDVQYVYISKTYKPRVRDVGETIIENIKEQTPSPSRH